MGVPDWGTYGKSERGKGPRTKKKRNALRKRTEQIAHKEFVRSLPPIEIKVQENR